MAIKTAAAARPAVKSTAKTTSKTAKKSVSTSSSKSNTSKSIKTASTGVKKVTKAAASAVKSAAAQSTKRDTFTKTGTVQKAGIYSVPVPSKSKAIPAAGGAFAIAEALKQSGIALMNRASAANSRLNNISPEVMYCQTAGWWGDENNGSKNCSYTAIATMASINLRTSVKPNQIKDECVGINAGTLQMDRIRMDEGGYKKNTVQDYYDNCRKEGFRYYQFSNSDEVLKVVNNELANDRSVVVKTTYSSVHWVTVTGTVNGQKATQFNDLKGIDPWYNGTGNNSVFYNNDPRYNGIFQLSQNSNQTFHGDYAVMTISGGR